MTPCVLWTKAVATGGYGTCWHEGKQERAHRVAYALQCGKSMLSLVGVVIRHKCDNKLCVNPDHLEEGTQQDNIDDCVKRGRRKYVQVGEAHHLAKITDADVISIKAEYLAGAKQYQLAKKYGINQSQISRICNDKAWKR